MRNKGTYFLAVALLAFVFASCGVKKKNVLSRKYHSTTTLFNYYYNGELKWQEGVDQINAAYRIPPEGYIDVLYIGTEEDAKTYKDNFESAIEKAEIALQKHDQQDNKWMDDLRYLIGRSWFYSRSYLLATKNFEHVIETYPQSKLIPDVYLWLVKTHYMDGNNIKALEILEEDMKKLIMTKRQRGEMAMVQSQILLDQGNYDQLVRVLNRNLKNIRGRINRARANYLLGQIYRDQGDMDKAYDSFKRVTKINTDYELIFNAKLELARIMIGNQGRGGESAKVNRYLKKMLRDEKNLDYRDQIYYEMAMLDIERNLLEPAIDDLKMSVRSNTNNQRQKALSYYKIGQIYFYDLKDFPKAGVYFDSAATSINTDAPEYAEISNISNTLKEYIGHINTIHLQDSLLQLSKMTDREIERRADRILAETAAAKKVKQEEELAKLDALNDPNNFANLNNNRGGRKSQFYFNSPDLVTEGKISFQQLWGNRKNEDNWRRKNKSLNTTDEAIVVEDTTAIDAETLEKYGSAEKARMIQNVPRTPEAIAAAEAKVAAALYGLGQVYENKLTILDSAIANYKKLVRRFPDDEYALKGRYALYRIYKDKIQDSNKADKYEVEICGNYPDSRYCRIIKNGIAGLNDDEEFEDYNSAYSALLTTFNNKDYETVVSFSSFIAMQYPAQPSLAKVYYMRGKSFGYTGQKDSLRSVYEYIARNFPDAEVTPEVRRTLELITGKKDPTLNANNGTIKNPDAGTGAVNSDNPAYKGFTLERKKHEKVYIVMLVDKSKIKSNELQQKLNDYNRKTIAEKRLNVSVFLYKGKFHLPYISQFNTEQEAMGYISNLMKEPGIGDLFSGENEKVVFITPANFRTAYGKKRFEDYFIYYQDVILPSIN